VLLLSASAVGYHKWLMARKLLLLTAVTLLAAHGTRAQPVGTWTTQFADGGTAWLVIRPPALMVVNQNSEGKCMSVAAKVPWDEMTPLNRDWTVRRKGDSLTITFPPTFATDQDTTVRYSRTTEDPIALCQNKQDI